MITVLLVTDDSVAGQINDQITHVNDVCANLTAQIRDALEAVAAGGRLEKLKLTYTVRHNAFACLRASTTATADPADKGEFTIASLPAAPLSVVAHLGGEAGVTKIRQFLVHKYTVLDKWNPMAHGTKLYWYSGEPHDAEIPEMKWATDWANLEAEPPSVGIIDYNEYKIKVYCRCCWAT